MRSTIIALAGLLLASPPAAHAAPSPQKVWVSGPATATARTAEIGVPLTAGTLANSAFRDAQDKGIDLAAQYETADGKIIGTIFLYAPSRPDAGLTWLATDDAIRRRLGPDVRIAEDRMIAVAGVPDAGRRMAYVGRADAKLSGDPDGRVYSIATILRAGEWMVKVRVTGPISRSAEIGANLDALVAGMTFSPKAPPLPSNRIAATTCAPGSDRAQVEIRKPSGGEALAVLMSLDSAVDEAGKAIANPLRGAIDRLCLERQEMQGGIPMLTYRVEGAPGGILVPRLVMLYGDAGIMMLAFESSRHKGEFFLVRHAIGRTFLIGRTTGLPSHAELKAIILDPDNQPAVITVTEDRLADPKAKTISVNCNLTTEGCDADKK